MDFEKITFDNCKSNFDLRQYLTKNQNCYAISLRKYKRPMYQKGKFYWCSYWAKPYKVLEVQTEKIKCENGYIYNRLISVTVKWLNDNRIGTHCTSLDQRDYELVFE